MGKTAGLVLSDELLTQFYQFMNNREHDKVLIKKLLHYYKPVYLTNIAQLDRIKYEPDMTLKINLVKSNLVHQTLEELAQMTRFKIILCTDRNDFPFVNINGDKLENNYSGTFIHHEPRVKAIAHIKALCADVKKEVIVYDKYFCSIMNNVEVLKQILPQRKLTIRFDRNSFSERQQHELKNTCSKWELSEEMLPENHDRYLIIDNKMEIVLTSGFKYLTDVSKDFSYLVRKIDGHQFV